MFQIAKDAKLKIYGNRNSTVKDSLIHDTMEPTYWTQYHRTHSLLGAKLGEGEVRQYPNRKSYNVLTGEELKSPCLRSSHNRVSGNSVLDSGRTQDRNIIG